MTEQKLYPILCCDGGGIRGLLTALLLERLEEKLQSVNPGTFLRDYFEMFAGVSTGSIIACGLVKGITAREIKEFYIKDGKAIFPDLDLKYWLEGFIHRVGKGDFSLPLFKGQGLEDVLRNSDIFPDSLEFKDLSKPTLILSYDTYNRQAVVFKSKDPDFANIKVWEICRASSAAPVAFPGYLLSDPHYLETVKNSAQQWDPLGPNLKPEIDPSGGIPLIDGGVVMGNPTLCTIAERIRLNKTGAEEFPPVNLDKILIASFGTGQQARRIEAQDAESWGGFDWVDMVKGIPLLDVYSDGGGDAIDYIATQLVSKDNYLRFQPALKKDTSAFHADEANLQRLTDAATDYLNSGGDGRLDQLAEVLINNKNT